MEGPLSGVRVLAFERALAGPVCSMILGDLGAEVIKIEPPQGDYTRATTGADHKGETAHYLAYNRSKKGMVLDISTGTGKEAFLDLVRISDVALNNFRPGVMERLGLGYQDLSAINPRIICANLTGWGPSGPYRDKAAVEGTISGFSGIMSVTGEPGGRPVRPGPAVSDYTNALYGVVSIIAALYEREKTGMGQEVHTSLVGGSIALMGYHIAHYTCSGKQWGPLGSGYPMIVPYGAYKAQEGYVVLGACWPRIARTIGAEWLVDDPRFKSLRGRIEHRDELNSEIEKALQQLTAEEWIPILQADDIQAEPLNTVDKLVDDPQLKHLDLILEIEHTLGGKIKLAGNPIMMSSLKGEYLSPPILGEHTDEILSGLLGYSEEKIGKLKDEQKANAEALEAHVNKRR